MPTIPIFSARSIRIFAFLAVTLAGCSSNTLRQAEHVTPVGEYWLISTESSGRSVELFINGRSIAWGRFSGNEQNKAFGSGIYRGQHLSFQCAKGPEQQCRVFAGGQQIAVLKDATAP